MNPPQKSFVRLAIIIHRALTAPIFLRPPIELPHGAWRRASDLDRQIRRAEFHRWQLAAMKLHVDFRHALTSLQAPLAELERLLKSTSALPYIARSADIYQDLLALEAEFESVSFDSQKHCLSVTTEPITLAGQYLGSFEIRLDLRQLAAESPYRVVALDPHPAASREGVTHPHVLDEVLCEGEGRTAIRQAVVQGRLLDFFQLVVNLLRTYNRDSPFVELALWNGEDCSDCGETVSPEYRILCERCEDTICGECQATCGDCGRSFCTGCISKCAHCLDAHCGRCLNNCIGCSRVVCTSCFDNQERCPDCHEEDISDDTDSPAETSGAPVHADRVGKAAVPSGCG